MKGYFDKNVTFTNIDHLQHEAKEMHKQEILDAYIDRMDCTDKEHMRKILGGQYYQETFKTNK